MNSLLWMKIWTGKQVFPSIWVTQKAGNVGEFLKQYFLPWARGAAVFLILETGLTDAGESICWARLAGREPCQQSGSAQTLPIPLWQLIYLIHLDISCSKVEGGVSAIRDDIILGSRAILTFSEKTMTLALLSARGTSSLVTCLVMTRGCGDSDLAGGRKEKVRGQASLGGVGAQ